MKRDPIKTARNNKIKELTFELYSMRDAVLKESGFNNIQSLHGTLGGKNHRFINLHNDVIVSPEMYLEKWVTGFFKELNCSSPEHDVVLMEKHLSAQPLTRAYLKLFLTRTFLREYESLSKVRPEIHESEFWIGQNHEEYGLFVSPRFKDGKWENDKSEIRRLDIQYWSIGHVLRTGLVIPDKNEVIMFKNIEDYLLFFKNVLVRPQKSSHQMKIADLYSQYVQKLPNPNEALLLIPELRYGGKSAKHEHRLDYCIIDIQNHAKIGFELSPASTHIHIEKISDKTQKTVNEEISDKFEKEANKLKDFFKGYGIYTLIYTGKSLEEPEMIFKDMKRYITSQVSTLTCPESELVYNFFKSSN